MMGRRRRNHERSGPPTAAATAFAATVVLAPELLGGVTAWSLAMIAGASAITLLGTLWAFRARPEVAASAGLVVVLGGLLAFTILQATPLPCAFVEWLSRDAAHHARVTASILGQDARCTVSFAPGATLNEVVKLASVIAMLLSGYAFARGGHRKFVLGVVGVSGTVMAIVALAHAALGLEQVFGVFVPRSAEPRLLVAPLINANHLGGFLALALPLLLALTTMATSSLERIFWGAFSFITALAITLTFSRGAYASALVSVALGGALFLRRRARIRKGGVRISGAVLLGAAAVALALLGAVALGVAISGERFAEEATNTDTSKLQIAVKGLELGLSRPSTGVGRGAFSSAFAQAYETTLRFAYPENIVAQWVSEWGLWVGGMLLLLLLSRLVRIALRTTSETRIAAVAAILGYLVHEFFDFSAELAGPAVVAAALLGALLASASDAQRFARDGAARDGAARDGAGPLPRGPRRAMAPTLALAATSVLAIVALAPGAGARDVQLLEKRLTSAFESGDREDFAETLRRAALGFPAEPSFALLAGAEGVRYRTPGTGRWLSRAMTLAPGWGGPHAEAALALLNVGNRNQAILELGAAAARDLPGARKVTCLFVPRVGAAIANAAPSDPVQRLRFLDQAASCPGATPEFAEKMDADILAAGKLSPETRYARLRIARRALAARDADKAIGALERMSLSNPKDADLGALYAHALLSAGRHSDALRALDRLRKASPTTDEPLRVEAHVRAKLGDIEGSKKVIEKLRGRAHARGEALASVSLLEADIEEGLGHMHRALTALEDAMRYRATPHTLARIARVAESAGLTGRARTAHRSLCEGRMDGVRRAEHCQALDRLEKNGP